MAFFSKPKYSTVTVDVKKKDIPKDLYTRCPLSGEIVYNKELEKNLMVVPKSGYHFPLSAYARIDSLLDEGTFEEKDGNLTSVDFLNFRGLVTYKDKLKQDLAKSGLSEAAVCGSGKISKIPVSVAVTDFRFIGGSMGSVVGEKITRAIERATAEKCPLLIVSASGGARMQEGIISLMQMAKTTAALGRFRAVGAPFFSVLTNPTYGGVTASFPTLGDIIIAEPGAFIGFAGRRVIKETTQEDLPTGFQTAEFLLEHGLIDQIVHRHELRSRIITLLHALHCRKQPVNGKHS
jgi:acetyl-CoA carboxylase carboxyl transferase subunit beta